MKKILLSVITMWAVTHCFANNSQEISASAITADAPAAATLNAPAAATLNAPAATTLNASAATTLNAPAATTLNAPAAASIVGDWVTHDSSFLKGEFPGELKNFEVNFVFGKRTLDLSFDMEVAVAQEGISMTMGMKASVKGEYTQEGDKITITVDPKATKVNIYKLDLPAVLEEQLKEGGMTKDMMLKMMNNQMNNEAIASFNDMGGEMFVKSVTATQLVLGDENDKLLTLTRKAKK